MIRLNKHSSPEELKVALFQVMALLCNKFRGVDVQGVAHDVALDAFGTEDAGALERLVSDEDAEGVARYMAHRGLA